MGILKYDQPVDVHIGLRVTRDQANSLTVVAQAMSLTVTDLIRASVDAWIEDVPEPRVLTARVIYVRRTPA